MEKYYWLNEDSRKFLSKGYLKKGVTPEERIQKIGDTAEAILGIGGFSAKFIDYLSRGWYSLASPVWSNFGEATGLPISCNSSYVEDSVASILYTAAEVGMMTKFGAGTSAYFGDVRHRGAPISGGGESFGAVHFMQLFETTTDVISQSNVRRGSFAAYYPIDGKDIKEFLEIRGDGNPLQQISMGVTVSDDWMKSMIAGDKSKRAIWASVIKKRMESGYPYIFWTDTVNDGAPQVYKDKNLKIKSSNLCVTGDQRVVSNFGLLTAKELYEMGDNLVLFDGTKQVNSTRMRLVEKDANVYKITLANGMTHTVTDYHKVLVKEKFGNVLKECKDLTISDNVIYQSTEGIFGSCHLPKEAYKAGKELDDKIPNWIFTCNKKTQLEFLSGVYQNHLKLHAHPTLVGLKFNVINDLQLILTNLGIRTSISYKGANGMYLCIFDEGIHFTARQLCNSSLGYNLDYKGGYEIDYTQYEKNFSKIKSIQYMGKEDVYCVTVDSKEHLWVCNGFVTSNCTEIALLTDKDNSFVCDLSSMNLMHFDDWKDTDAVEVLTYFLDAVMTEYITKIKGVPFMDKAYNFAVNQRALGIGALGWHSYLQSKMIAFESMEAKLLNTKIFKFIQEKTIKASKEMASLYGEPPLLEGYGMRNVTLQAVAPTTSSSFILGQVSPSIEPLDSNYFVKDLAKGKFTFKNPFLKELLISKSRDNRETWNSILDHGGSVQHLNFLSENEKDVFKTFSEISQKEIIIQAAARQHYIDQAQSINLRISEDIPTKEINELMIFAWENKVKTLYYQLGTNPSQKLARSILNCASCEA